MKSILKYLFRIIEVLLIICSLFICINNLLTPEDNLAFAISRIENLTGYDLDKRKTELILHKTNRCDSIVMVHDDRSTNEIYKQMQEEEKSIPSIMKYQAYQATNVVGVKLNPSFCIDRDVVSSLDELKKFKF